MSKVVDERIVEMRFDNRQFESNVSQSMSTLQKLKQSLKLDGASKGIDDINRAAKNVDMSPLGRGVEAVSAKFSALQVMGTTALVNITNQAVNAGKRIVSALTIDPVKSGFQEYETQINAVQTILANTQKEGTTITDVNAALDELNAYADKTIYNFTEMTRNIGTFTAAGVDLDTSVNAIQGIANLAAVSGSTSQQASTAMYQLSQALASGTVKLMDWNSVVNAGMGGQVFQDALKETARVHGIAIDQMVEDEGSFRETLSKGWLTADILTETLQKFTLATEGLTNEQIQANREMLRSKGYTEEQIDEIFKLGNTATNAATKVKTLTQLWDVLKEAAQSGWSQTWRLIIGDFEEAKAIFTPLADFFTNIIGKMSDARNELLESAFAKGFSELSEKFITMLKPAKEAMNTVQSVTNAITDLDGVVSSVIRGDFGSYADRYNALRDAGYNWCVVQNKVNETLGCSKRYTQEQIDEENKLLGVQKKTTEVTSEVEQETTKLTKAQKDHIKVLAKKEDAWLKERGYTYEQIEAFKELRKTADTLGLSLDDFVDNIDEINGRWLLINSFKNIGKSIVKIFSAIGEAWRGIFKGMQPESLFNGIASFHKFTSQLIISDETAQNITKTMKGLFAIIDIIAKVAGGGFKIAFTIIAKLLGAMGYGVSDLLSFTAALGDAISKVHDFIFNNKVIDAMFEALASGILKAVEGIKALWEAFKNSPKVQKFVERLLDAFDKLKDIDFKSIGENIIKGLKNGLSDGISGIVEGVKEIGQKVIEAFCDLLGIHSPSTVFFEFGRNIIEGLIEGIKSLIKKAPESIKSVGTKIIDVFENISNSAAFDKIKSTLSGLWDVVKKFDFSKLLSLIPIGVALAFSKKIYDVASVLSNGVSGINEVLEGFSKIETSFAKVGKAYARNLKSKAWRNIAISIAILAGTLIILSYYDTDKLWESVKIIVALAGILAVLSFAINKLDSSSVAFQKDGKNISASMSGIKNGLIAIGASILLLALTVKLIGSMKPEEAMQGFLGLAAILAVILIVFAAFGLVSKAADKNAKHIKKAGSMILKVAVAMLIMTIVAKRAAKLSITDMGKAALFMGGFLLFIAALVKVTTIAKESKIAKIGGLLLAISFSMFLMVGVVKLVGLLRFGDIVKGIIFVGGFVLFVAALTKAIKLIDNEGTARITGVLLSFSFSLLMMIGVCKLVGKLSPSEMIKGGLFVLAFVGVIALLVSVLKVGNEEKMGKAASTILAFSIAIGILALVAVLLGVMSVKSLAKGITAVAILGLIMAAMVRATKGAQNVKASLIVLVAAIAVMVLAVVGLSMMDPKALARSTGALVAMMLSFAAMEKCLPKKTSLKLLATLLVMTLVVGLLAGIIVAMDKLGIENALVNAASLSLLLLTFAASMKIVSSSEGIALKAIPGIIAMVVAVGLLAGVLWALDTLDVTTNIETVGSLCLLLLAFSAATLILSKVGAGASAAVAGAIALDGVIVVVGGLIYSLGYLNSLMKGSLSRFLDEGIPILEKIGYGLGSFFGSIVEGFGTKVMNLIPKLGTALGLFMAGAQPFIMGAKLIDTSVLEGISILTAAIIELSVAKFIDGITSFLSFGKSFADLGKSLSDFTANALPFFFALKILKPEDAEAAKTLADTISSLTGSNIKNLVATFISGGDPFATMGTQLANLATAMVGFSDTLKDSDIDTEKITKVAEAGIAMADLQDAIDPIGGVLQKLTGVGDLSDFGTQIANYANALKTASTALTTGDGEIAINAAAIRAASRAGMAMADLQDAIDPIGGVLQKLTGVGDLSDFGTQINNYANALKTASSVMTNSDGSLAINSDNIQAATDAGIALAGLQDSIDPILGLKQKFTGVKDLGAFGLQIVSYMNLLKLASASLINDDGTLGVNKTIIQQAVDCGISLAGLQDSIEPMMGLKQAFTGVKDLGEFGTQISTYFEQLKIASQSLKGENGYVTIDKAAIDNAIGAGERLADLQKYLPEDKWFDGKMDLEEFGTKITPFGDSLSAFSTSLKDIDTDKISVGITCANRLATLAKRLVELDVSGISNFKAIKGIGTAIKKFYEEVSSVSPDILDSSVSSALKLKNLVSGLLYIDPSGIENFKVDGIGEAIKSYYNKVSSIDTTLLYLSITNATRLRDFITSLIGFDGGGVASFVEALDTLGTADLQSVIAAFSSGAEEMFSIGQNFINNFLTGIQQSQVLLTNMFVTTISLIFSTIRNTGTSFVAAGRYIMTRFANGMRTQVRYVTSAATSSLSNAVRSIRLYYSNFKDAGKYLGQGLIDGMNTKQQEAYNAGHALGKISARGVKDGAQEQSPSKLTTQYGEYLGEGLVIGMGNTLGAVYKQGKELGKGAATSVYNALNGAADAANVDYTPSIRPVVDLTSFKQSTGNLQIGADISSRLLSGPVNSLQQIVANAQSDITASNNEVIKAINGLREDLNMYYSSDDKEIALYMDTKKVASTIAKPMNRELNILAKRGAY